MTHFLIFEEKLQKTCQKFQNIRAKINFYTEKRVIGFFLDFLFSKIEKKNEKKKGIFLVFLT